MEKYSYGAYDIFTCSVLDDVGDANLSVFHNHLEGWLKAGIVLSHPRVSDAVDLG